MSKGKIIRTLDEKQKLLSWYEGIGQETINGSGGIEARIRRLELLLCQVASDRVDALIDEIKVDEAALAVAPTP